MVSRPSTPRRQLRELLSHHCEEGVWAGSEERNKHRCLAKGEKGGERRESRSEGSHSSLREEAATLWATASSAGVCC